MRKVLRDLLVERVPQSQIDERIAGLDDPTEESIQRALGFNTFEDASLLLYGKHLKSLDPESLLGKYVAETQAATLYMKFGTKPNSARGLDSNSRLGPERLVVKVSEASMPVWMRLFARPELMMHAHGKAQGTLLVGHDGQVGSYMQIPRVGKQIRYSTGAIWPTIVLSSSEAGRARTYFDLGDVAQSFVKTPWQLDGFCARGAYSSCTHWWGEMGIGDQLVSEWEFPGAIDEHADQDFTGISGNPRAPRVQKLGPWSLPASHNLRPDAVRKLKRLFTFPEAHQQLAHMLGTRDQLVRGEWANPGYVAITLLGHASVIRVPVIFLNSESHRTAISENFKTSISAY